MADGLRIVAIRLLSREPERLAAFLSEALGFTAEAPGHLRLGDEWVEIQRTDGPPYPAPVPANDPRFQHFAVIVSDIDAAYGHLEGVGGWTPISKAGPVQLPEASGGVRAFKFRSPEGHPLELLQFPAGRVPNPWNSRPGLHLGIDHSAIVVAETARSNAFYEGLGFTLGSRQLNRGAEQARLDGLSVDDPAVEVVALTPPGGAPPHLELLCYRRPAALATVPVEETGVAATRLVCSEFSGALGDPDGHRLVPE